MVSCSRRRKTKNPFCKDDPKCYWNNKSCKKRPGVNNDTRRNSINLRNRSHYDSNAKLNRIIQKLNSVETAIHKMTKKREGKSRINKQGNISSHKRVRNNNASARTASPTNVALLLNQSRNSSAKTASPGAVNRLKERMNQN